MAKSGDDREPTEASRPAREAGQQVVGQLRRSFESRIAELIRRDPDRAANAIEVGLIDRDWLEQPGESPIRTATRAEVLQRFVERSVQQRPSVLGTLGLNALQLLAWEPDEVGGESAAVPMAVVFTDLEGFTRYTSSHGDEAALALLDHHHKAMAPVVRGRGGRVVKRLGDGLMLTFPSSDAAAYAAVELLDAAPEELRMRVGVHVGEVMATRDDVVGHVVNVAARVTEQAKGGEALATTEVRDDAGELRHLAFGRARRVRLKGVPEAVSVCRITAT